ncbi:ATP-binding protein [Roseiconus lacunae]|uniref:ATP-binding protein n=1 Tax=Roseiconus lacunae TaxID=2605694 RepID=A0ABT7PF42_9BACT|nr:ATP-binding protein [Roseiconus lacunae]MDM4015115.1 ATP-binding protein [Roseiconus lacunae]
MIPNRERSAVLQSLSAGVVPAIGLQHIQVGRLNEVDALVNDLKLVEEDGASVRFIVGRFGSGKTFFLNLIRNVAQKRKFVVAQADITTERRFHGSGGQARSLYTELMRNLSTRSKPEGNALQNVVERWVGEIDHSIRQSGSGNEDDVKREFVRVLRPLQDLVSGFDFVNVISKYYEGYISHNEEIQANALRWLRAEYTTKTEARQDLGVRSIIDDSGFYDYLKLFAGFVRLAGYAGLLVNVDELVVLSHRLSNTTARNNNYEALLRIINDCLQGRAEGLAFLFAGTDECLEDQRRGLYSYEALATRLAPNRFADEKQQDYSSPVIKLENLTPEDCLVLLLNIRRVHAGKNGEDHFISKDGLVAFLKNCQSRMGAAYFQTPRETIKDFVSLLNILEQDQSRSWKDHLQTLGKANESSAEGNKGGQQPASTDEDLTEFRL